MHFGDMVARYVHDETSHSIGMTLIPSARRGDVVERCDDLRQRSAAVANLAIEGLAIPASSVDPLVHLKVMGDAYPGGFSQGRTMRGAGRLRYTGQQVDDGPDGTRVRTRLTHPSGLVATHEVRWVAGDPFLVVQTSVVNEGQRPGSCLDRGRFIFRALRPGRHDAGARIFSEGFGGRSSGGYLLGGTGLLGGILATGGFQTT